MPFLRSKPLRKTSPSTDSFHHRFRRPPQTKQPPRTSNSDEPKQPRPSPLKHSKSFPLSSHDVTGSDSDDDDDDVPLSLSFLRRPSRSSSMDHNIERIMRQNTLYNSKLRGSSAIPASPDNSINTGDTESYTGDDAISSGSATPSSPGSPTSPSSPASYPPPYALVRKKSGELVKSSLKLRSLGSSRSLPATPTYKQVHFGGGTRVCYFDQRDRPSSISGPTTPYDSDDDGDSSSVSSGSSSDSGDYFSPHPDSTRAPHASSHSPRAQPHNPTFWSGKTYFSHCHTLYQVCRDAVDEPDTGALQKFQREMAHWRLNRGLFPRITYTDQLDREVPVFLESCRLISDHTQVVGYIAVKNVGYTKNVTVRYTFNSWISAVNIRAVYTINSSGRLRDAGYDRFVFRISVPVLFSQYLACHSYSTSLAPTFSFCIRYTAEGQEYWDNNFNRNYTLQFVRKEEDDEQGAESTSGSTPVVPTNSPAVSPIVPPASAASEPKLRQSHAFRNRTPVEEPSPAYRDGTSIASFDSPGTPSILKSNTNSVPGNFLDTFSLDTRNTRDDEPLSPLSVPTCRPGVVPLASATNTAITANPTSATASSTTPNNSTGTSPVKPGIDSESYQTLLKKYCFFKSPKTVSSFLEDDENESQSMLDDRHFY